MQQWTNGLMPISYQTKYVVRHSIKVVKQIQNQPYVLNENRSISTQHTHLHILIHS